MFNYFSISGLFIGFINLTIAVLITISSRKRLHKVWAYVNYAISIFGFGIFISGSATKFDTALLGWKIFTIGIEFIAVLYYHVIFLFCGLKSNRFLKFCYLQTLFFIPLIIFTNYLFKIDYLPGMHLYYLKAGIFFTIFMGIWTLIVGKSFFELYKHIRKSSGISNIQGKYLFLAMMFGFGGGLNTAPAAWGFNVYPYGQIFVCFYAAVVSYAIFRYHIMDIRVAVTRLGIFAVIYSLVLGIPFGLVTLGKSWLIGLIGENWFWVPMVTLLALATAGPFIFIYIQRRAEKAFLQEEQRTQDLLMQVSYGMNTIHNLGRLLELIVTITVKTLRVDSGKIFLLNREADKYELMTPGENNGLTFNQDDPLVEQLRQKQYPIIYDEMKVLSEMNGDTRLKEVEARMRGLPAHLIVPITLNNSLLGFLVLGERQSRDMYSRGLLNALSVLGHQAAIAIDRCIYLEAETKRLEEEGLKERILSLDHMASSMAHEIDNPMHSVNVTAGFIRDLLKDARVRYLPAEILNEFHAALDRIRVSGERVSGIVKAILDYSKMGKGKGEFKPVNIKEAVEGFSYLIGGEIKKEMVRLDIQAEDNLPPILGDRIQLEEIFVNFIRNSIHAVKHKPKEDRRIVLKIFKKDYKTIRIECIDGGYGIEKNLLKDIFLANVTTKGSSEGTGLGLHRVRKIVDAFGGRVWAESEGKDKGATLIVELPSYDGDKIARMDILNTRKEEKKEGKQTEDKEDGQSGN